MAAKVPKKFLARKGLKKILEKVPRMTKNYSHLRNIKKQDYEQRGEE